jgi:predicted dehydrogenase
MQKMIKKKNRRSFLKTSLLTAAGLYIIPRHVLGRGFVSPSDKLRVAGIGAGGKGESDLAMFSASKKADIVALCDVDSRQTVSAKKKYAKATVYKDFREMLDKEHAHIDAVSVSTPDHQHAVAAMAAMQLNKHVFVQKPLSHDIYEARMLTEAAHRYKVVTQMGNQGASGDGVRLLIDWYKAGLIGDVHTVHCFTDRPVWPQGIPRPNPQPVIPPELDWNLWLGTAPKKDYIDGLVPFNWRGWWDYGTGALGDMGCHIIGPAFQVLEPGYPVSAECSVGAFYSAPWQKVYNPESCPPSSHVVLQFPAYGGKPPFTLHWYDGGIMPERPEELGPGEIMGDGGNGTLFIGTKGKMMCGTYGANPQLLPLSKTKETTVPSTITRVPGSDNGHYAAWVQACIDGYGSQSANELSSRFDVAGPLTETVLMGNLALQCYDIRIKQKNTGWHFPGRNIKLIWDGPAMKVTNFDDANQFVQRKYRDGWTLGI